MIKPHLAAILFLALHDGCEYIVWPQAITIRAAIYGDNGAERRAKETQANRVLMKCFGVHKVVDIPMWVVQVLVPRGP